MSGPKNFLTLNHPSPKETDYLEAIYVILSSETFIISCEYIF